MQWNSFESSKNRGFPKLKFYLNDIDLLTTKKSLMLNYFPDGSNMISCCLIEIIKIKTITY